MRLDLQSLKIDVQVPPVAHVGSISCLYVATHSGIGLAHIPHVYWFDS